jgi:hypothetical protein
MTAQPTPHELVTDATAERWAELLALPYSVETQNQIAKLFSPDKEAWQQVSAEQHFENATKLLSLISSKIVGNEMTLSHSYASAVLGKICLTAMSASTIFRAHEAGELPTLDHSSIAVLSRTIIESAIMYSYLTEEVSDEEWTFRLQVMKVHDSAARVRFWKSMMPEEADLARTALEKLRTELKELALFKKRPERERSTCAVVRQSMSTACDQLSKLWESMKAIMMDSTPTFRPKCMQRQSVISATVTMRRLKSCGREASPNTACIMPCR